MNRWKRKSLAFLTGFITIVILLEAGLRIVGVLYPKRHVSENKISRIPHNEDYVILCIGDSFTFGMGAAYDDSYPKQLEKMLNADNFKKKFRVFNAGVVASNSSQASKKLREELEQYSPNLVIALVGVKDENLEDSNYWLFAEKKEMGIKKYYYKKVNYFLTKFRTYRLLKLLTSDLKRRATAYKAGYCDTTEKELANKDTEKNKSRKSLSIEHNKEKEYINLGFAYLDQRRDELAMRQAKNALELNPNNASGHLILGTVYRRKQIYDLAKSEIAKAIEINPKNSWAYSELGYIYFDESRIDPSVKEKNITLAIELLNKAIDLNPKEAMPYLTLGHIYFFQLGRADLAIKTARKVLEFDPTNDEAKRRLNIYQQPLVNHRAMDKLLEYDLKNIIKLAMDSEAAVIILGYPQINFKDKIRRKVALRYGIPFIDLYSIFNDLLEGHNQKDFFAADGHCNTNGYKIIAKEIYKVIKSDLIKEDI
jgi:tetratricopeptide (TPR) repeat protein